MELQPSCSSALTISHGSSRSQLTGTCARKVLLSPRYPFSPNSESNRRRLLTKSSARLPTTIAIPPSLDRENVTRTLCLQFSDIKPQFLEERDEKILSERLLKLSRKNKVRSALELFVSMFASGIIADSHACNSLIACLTRNSSLEDALAVFEIIRKGNVFTGHTFSLILNAVARERGCRSAVGVFLEMESEEKSFDVVVYNTMISVCGRSKNWMEVERIWKKLKESNCKSNMLTYRLLVSSFVQCGQEELALAAYEEMMKENFQPDEDTMKGVISVCTKEGNWESGLIVFYHMLQKGIKPNAIIFNSMINCVGKAGESDHAFKIYELMRSYGLSPDLYTWNALLNSLYRSQRYSDVLRLFEFIAKGEEELNVHIYNVALMSCQRLRLWDHSLQILWNMEELGMSVPTESYNLVLLACEKANQAKVAMEVYEHMIHRKCIPDTFTHLSLIRSCIWGSLWIEVDEILRVSLTFYSA